MNGLNTPKQAILLAGLALSANFLGGCVAAGIHGTTYAVKASDRSGLEEAAEAGDPDAITNDLLGHMSFNKK